MIFRCGYASLSPFFLIYILLLSFSPPFLLTKKRFDTHSVLIQQPHPTNPILINFSDTCIMIASFIGSRRPSLASVHSTSSSVRSYSMMRFEKETQQKEIRQEMKLRLARLQQQQHLTQNKPQIVIGEALMQHGALSRVTMATPSPLTPNSLDELLPSLDENQEVSYETWKQ